MTAVDLRAEAARTRRNNTIVMRIGVVTITCDEADALADLIDAARPFADGCSCGDCQRLTAAFAALDQEAPT